ncbi:MAG TPA: amidase [Candidatus Dormibacteraeota bacterium]|nr:amidase [Candidatus Dormibacteraeota bacterium]
MTLHYRSLLEVSQDMQARRLSPVELTRATLERIERLNPRLGAYYTVFAEQSLAEAREAESEIAAGRWRGQLQGVPIAFKDLYELGPTTAGSRLLAGNVARREAVLVKRARTAGAVVLGKLATHEFGLAAATLADHFPPARNPWDPERTPGGSSTGAGTALAAGMAFGAFGTDTGGSVRLPAAFSGVVGFKPTFGLLSTDGLIPLSTSLDHAGPIARTVADAAALAGVAFDSKTGVRGLRVGVPRDFWDGGDPQVRELVEAAVKSFAGDGAVVEDVRLGFGVVQVMATGYLVTLPEAASYHLANLRAGRQGYGHEFGLVLRMGLLEPGHSYVHAQQARARISHRMAAVFASHDVLAMPTVGAFADPLPAGPRPLTRRISEQPTPQYTWLANLYGGPAVSVPCGFTREGLPVGLQLMGRPADDATVLRAAHAYERASAWRDVHPPLWP